MPVLSAASNKKDRSSARSGFFRGVLIVLRVLPASADQAAQCDAQLIKQDHRERDHDLGDHVGRGDDGGQDKNDHNHDLPARLAG